MGMGRPFLDDDGVMLETKATLSMPANDPDFQAVDQNDLRQVRLAEWSDQRDGIMNGAVGGYFHLRLGRGHDTVPGALYGDGPGIVASRTESKTNVLNRRTCSSSNTSTKLFPTARTLFENGSILPAFTTSRSGLAPRFDKKYLGRQARRSRASVGHRELDRQL